MVCAQEFTLSPSRLLPPCAFLPQSSTFLTEASRAFLPRCTFLCAFFLYSTCRFLTVLLCIFFPLLSRHFHVLHHLWVANFLSGGHRTLQLRLSLRCFRVVIVVISRRGHCSWNKLGRLNSLRQSRLPARFSGLNVKKFASALWSFGALVSVRLAGALIARDNYLGSLLARLLALLFVFRSGLS
jgi:hypothetical protein